MIDRMVADGNAKPCIVTTSKLEFMKGQPPMPGFKVHTLNADDYPTWGQRRRALFKLINSLAK